MTLKERISEAIEARFEYSCEKDGGRFTSDEMSETVMQVVAPAIGKLVLLYNTSKDFLVWFNKYPDLRMATVNFSNEHPYKGFADTVCEVNGFLLDISEKVVPYCWGSSPSEQEMAENGCDACAEQDDCFSASEVKR